MALQGHKFVIYALSPNLGIPFYTLSKQAWLLFLLIESFSLSLGSPNHLEASSTLTVADEPAELLSISVPDPSYHCPHI